MHRSAQLLCRCSSSFSRNAGGMSLDRSSSSSPWPTALSTWEIQGDTELAACWRINGCHSHPWDLWWLWFNQTFSKAPKGAPWSGGSVSIEVCLLGIFWDIPKKVLERQWTKSTLSYTVSGCKWYFNDFGGLPLFYAKTFPCSPLGWKLWNWPTRQSRVFCMGSEADSRSKNF